VKITVTFSYIVGSLEDVPYRDFGSLIDSYLWTDQRDVCNAGATSRYS